MNPDKQDADIADVLSAVGHATPPTPAALDNARDMLWLAIAEETLSAIQAPITSAEPSADQSQQPARRRPDNTQQTQRHRNLNPGT